MRLRAILFTAVLVAAAAPASATAQATGEIGGPPTMGGHLPYPPPQHRDKRNRSPLRARSEPIVIGVGFGPFGRIEIVGQDSNAGLCISIDRLPRGSESSACGPTALPKVIRTSTINWESQRRRSRSLTEISGFMQPTIASVIAVAQIRKGRKRSSKTVPGVVAVPGPDVLARLHQAPFGYFVADFRGCLTAKVRVHAFDPAGLRLGGSLANLGFPNRFQPFDPCEPGSSTVGFVVRGSARTAVQP